MRFNGLTEVAISSRDHNNYVYIYIGIWGWEDGVPRSS